MSERNILFSQLGVACFPVRLIELIPFMYQSFDLSGDPGEGWFPFDNLSGDTLISKLIKFVSKILPELIDRFPMLLS